MGEKAHGAFTYRSGTTLDSSVIHAPEKPSMQSNSPEIPTRNSAATARTAVESAAEHVQIARRDFLKLFGYGAAGVVLSGVSTDQNGMPELFGSAEAGPRRSKSPYGQAFKFDQRLLTYPRGQALIQGLSGHRAKPDRVFLRSTTNAQRNCPRIRL